MKVTMDVVLSVLFLLLMFLSSFPFPSTAVSIPATFYRNFRLPGSFVRLFVFCSPRLLPETFIA
ncbi:GPI-anchored surface protein, putative [Bodo saltans]|uniref:GPI-anchored surface protein, putative n=1 Tax=Bodo saltans TaxID=75058 RepID=A0A0S4ING7_BODSA|nr:GPI-anchored surface protein, putative [Bodo saltans]|eukprot:CUF66493.1 GPI-anchored surface protein, putative [Bodo saltans]